MLYFVGDHNNEQMEWQVSQGKLKEIIGPLPAFLALILVVLACVGLDQVSKYHSTVSLKTWSHDSDIDLYKGQRLRLAAIGDEFSEDSYLAINFNYVRNPGAAWGMLANLRDKYRIPFFISVTFVALIVLGLYFKATPPQHRVARYGIALILSGAIGNFIDRVRLGYVVDFIDIHWRLGGWQYYFPNFNIADAAITIGVGCLIFDMILFDVKKLKSKSVDNPSPEQAQGV